MRIFFLRRRQCGVCTIFSFILCLFYIFIWALHKKRIIPPKVIIGKQNNGEDLLFLQNKSQKCQIPKLDMYSPDVLKYFKNLEPLNCEEKYGPDWLELDSNSRLQMTDYSKKKYGSNIKCDLHYVFRKDDFENSHKIIEDYKFGTPVDQTDFFYVKCQSGLFQRWEKFFMQIVPFQKFENHTRSDKWSGLDVYFLGFDSLSQMSFRRQLPKTVKFLEESMQSVILNGYNIVGDGTPQAFIPILTGKTETELPSTRKRDKDSNFVDVYPWIWNNFSKNGYATLYGEDVAFIGTFTYRLKGFQHQPTHHYTRTFFLEAENELGEKIVTCLDEDLMLHLKKLFEQGYFNNALVIVMSDHGSRFSGLRDTEQGQLEERLPFFSIYLPEKIRNTPSGSLAYKNLLQNANRITSPFDIYATLQDVLVWPDESELSSVILPLSRSMSLFRPIPDDRTCEQAGIAPHWCTCLAWQSVMENPIDKEFSLLLAESIVQAINELTEPERKLCAHLKLHKLENSRRFSPHDGVMKYSGVKDEDGFVPDFDEDKIFLSGIYQLSFITMPGNAKYETTLKYDATTNKAYLDLTAISHVNKYAKQTCDVDSTPHLSLSLGNPLNKTSISLTYRIVLLLQML
uniref:DUF229 domain containing protein n=1 Tax=Acrobeloides nanus TaxID=290746 RepID=A0A914CD67_9BILA